MILKIKFRDSIENKDKKNLEISSLLEKKRWFPGKAILRLGKLKNKNKIWGFSFIMIYFWGKNISELI